MFVGISCRRKILHTGKFDEEKNCIGKKRISCTLHMAKLLNPPASCRRLPQNGIKTSYLNTLIRRKNNY